MEAMLPTPADGRDLEIALPQLNPFFIRGGSPDSLDLDAALKGQFGLDSLRDFWRHVEKEKIETILQALAQDPKLDASFFTHEGLVYGFFVSSRNLTHDHSAGIVARIFHPQAADIQWPMLNWHEQQVHQAHGTMHFAQVNWYDYESAHRNFDPQKATLAAKGDFVLPTGNNDHKFFNVLTEPSPEILAAILTDDFIRERVVYYAESGHTQEDHGWDGPGFLLFGDELTEFRILTWSGHEMVTATAENQPTFKPFGPIFYLQDHGEICGEDWNAQMVYNRYKCIQSISTQDPLSYAYLRERVLALAQNDTRASVEAILKMAESLHYSPFKPAEQ